MYLGQVSLWLSQGKIHQTPQNPRSAQGALYLVCHTNTDMPETTHNKAKTI